MARCVSIVDDDYDAQRVLGAMSTAERDDWGALQVESTDRSSWSVGGMSRALTRALRFWLAAGGGGREEALVDRRKSRAATEGRRVARGAI